MTRDTRPQAWLRADIPVAAVHALTAFRAEVRPQLLAYGHALAPFKPSLAPKGGHPHAITSESWCTVCGLTVELDCNLTSLACGVVPASQTVLAPCGGYRLSARA